MAGNLVMHLADSFYLLNAVSSNTDRKTQVSLGKQIQDRTPIDMFITQQIIVWIFAAISACLLPKLLGKVYVDVLAAVKQHDQKGGHNQGNPSTALFDCFKLPEYALYVKER